MSSPSKKPVASVLITDLDNTLWDWFELWYSSFQPFLAALTRDLDISEEVLKEQIKAVHQKHNTSEYTFLLQELPCVQEKLRPGDDPFVKFSDAIKEFRDGRKRASKLYPTVLETLQEIKRAGALVVGFTESQFYYTTQRLRVLKLDGLIDVLYTTQDRGLPPPDELLRHRKNTDSYYELKQTKTIRLPEDAVKPDPALLSMILENLGATTSDVVYVGDNLYKDVLMAQEANIRDVHAKYGEAHNDSRYDLLRSVTHWKPTAVTKEKSASADGIKPNFVLAKKYSELIELFSFQKFSRHE